MTHFQVGEPMMQDDIDDLPVGTTIAANMTSRHTYIHREDGVWHEVLNESRTHTARAFGNGYVVRSYPEGYTPPTPIAAATDYKWRFRNTTLRAAHSHSVSVDAVVAALNEMGAGFDALPLSVGQALYNPEDVYALPDGTLVQRGNPAAFAQFGLFMMRGGEAHHLLGAQDTLRAISTSIAELPPDYVPPQVAEDQAALDAFKVKAYVIGLKLKNAQDWCGTYENIVAPLGITPAAIRPLISGHELIGTKVNADGAAALPVGTVLGWRNEEHTACSWFVRVEQALNKAGTRRVFAHANEGVTGRPGHFSNSMTVAYVPGGDTVPETSVLREVAGLDVIGHWDLLPVGTVLSWRASQFYLMMRDQRATQFHWRPDVPQPVRDRGEYRPDAFSSPQDMRVVEFPAGEFSE